MAVNVVGVVGIVIFYLLILGVGIWAAMKKKKAASHSVTISDDDQSSTLDESEDVILAGRNIGLFVGAMTMTG